MSGSMELCSYCACMAARACVPVCARVNVPLYSLLSVCVFLSIRFPFPKRAALTKVASRASPRETHGTAPHKIILENSHSVLKPGHGANHRQRRHTAVRPTQPALDGDANAADTCAPELAKRKNKHKDKHNSPDPGTLASAEGTYTKRWQHHREAATAP